MAGGGPINPPPTPVEQDGAKLTSGWWGYAFVFTIEQIFGELEDLVINGVHIHQPHTGIDIKMPVGTALYNPVHAVVDAVGTDQYGNNFIRLTMDNGDQVLLLHLNDMVVKAGQNLSPGTLLGHSGDTGLSTGPHLHFEVDRGGKPIDPFSWLTVTGTTTFPGGGTDLNPFDALGHLLAPGHDPCVSQPGESGITLVIDAVACPSNWWRAGLIAVGVGMIMFGVFIYFIKEEKEVAKEGAEVAGDAAVLAA